MDLESQGKKVQQVIARARTNEAFRRRLLADPAAVLKEEGVEIPAGLELSVVEDTGNVVHLVIPEPPPPPLPDELSDEQLEHVAGGFFFHRSTGS